MDEHFYSGLDLHSMPLGALLRQSDLFRPIPRDWHIIITDIIGSTQSVQNGRHEDVNLVATGSIVTVLNIAFAQNITVPFFFGGDGATFLVPPLLIERLMEALALYKTNTLNTFDLELRTGTVPVQTVYDAGNEIRIAKFSSSKTFSIPIVLGNGLQFAEELIKGDTFVNTLQNTAVELDLSGMQCRWDKIPPPKNKEEIVTLLVVAGDTVQQASVFAKVLEKMDELYGAPDKRQPISVARLKLKTTFSRLSNEMRVQIGRIRWLELVRTWLITWYGYFYFKTKNGRKYLKTLVEMSDTLVIDGKINTVISGTVKQREVLQRLLDAMESKDEIYYGMYISTASIMSCYVRNLEDDHIHFVDGSEGGYTQAAKMLKAKLKN